MEKALTGYTEDTEVLTIDGWRVFPEINELTKVAVFDIDQETIQYNRPLRLIEFDYTGKVHHYKSENTDICVTENHLLYFKKLDTKEEEFIPSISFIDTSDWYYPAKFSTNDENIAKIFEHEDYFKKYPTKEILDYTGKIYNLSVETNMIVTRRNNHISINGGY